MNVCLRNTFVALSLLMGAHLLQAQAPVFYLPSFNNASPGSNKIMPLKVVNLDSVVAMQLVLRWDPKVLKFLTVDQFNFGNLGLDDFNTTHALDSGFVRVQYEGSIYPPGTSVPDSGTIFRLRFNVIGECTDSSPVKITEILDFPPLNFEVVKVRTDTSNYSYNLLQSEHYDGHIIVCYSVPATEPQASEIPVRLSSNPFSVSSKLEFELAENADIQILISDALGHITFKKNIFGLQNGQHGMVIEKDMLGTPGLYCLTLQAGRKIATLRFVLF